MAGHGEREHAGNDLLSKRAEMANRLRQNLTDPSIRDAVRQRCSSVPLGDAPAPRRADVVAQTGTPAGKRPASRERSARGTPASTRPASREGSSRGSAGYGGWSTSVASSNVTLAAAPGGRMQKSSSSGALSSASTASASTARPRLQRGGSSASRAPAVQVHADPIPIRGRRGAAESASSEASKVPPAAAAALAAAVTSLTGGGTSASAVSAAVAAAEGPLQQELLQVSQRLSQLESEKRRLAENSLSVLARCSSEGSLRPVATPATASSLALKTSPAQPARPDSSEAVLDGAEKHPWLLADGRLLTARLEGENLALKRAVVKARSEIDELLKGRAEAEARVRTLHEENSAAAEALRRCAGPSLLPQSREVGAVGAAEAAAGGTAKPAAVTEHFVLSTPPPYCTRGGGPGDSAAGETRIGPSARSQDKGGGCNASPASHISAYDEQARSKLLQTSEDICRRMEELLSRRGKKLHVDDDSTVR
eukprot:TRINITY_DN61302_c0_g1_i1.p1 TRINITY_DN61302_c0_g1~~TRINITY_DN61302_c0_g1_i1.p1  ORF type:complete len:489 (-),score=131.62 TRINITY_DN61302_c0_g1_i1:41-1486(-)